MMLAKKEIEATLDSSLALLAEGAKSDERNGFWVDKWHDTVISIIKDYRDLGVAPEAAYERADAKMANIPELEEIAPHGPGHLLVPLWLGGPHESLRPECAGRTAFDLLEERLTVAKKAFEEAWKLRPENVYAAADLMDIDKAIGGDRATMELWFDRAMKANGDSARRLLDQARLARPQVAWHAPRRCSHSDASAETRRTGGPESPSLSPMRTGGSLACPEMIRTSIWRCPRSGPIFSPSTMNT